MGSGNTQSERSSVFEIKPKQRKCIRLASVMSDTEARDVCFATHVCKYSILSLPLGSLGLPDAQPKNLMGLPSLQ